MEGDRRSTSERDGDKFAMSGYQTQDFNEDGELETVDDDDLIEEDDFADDFDGEDE